MMLAFVLCLRDRKRLLILVGNFLFFLVMKMLHKLSRLWAQAGKQLTAGCSTVYGAQAGKLTLRIGLVGLTITSAVFFAGHAMAQDGDGDSRQIRFAVLGDFGTANQDEEDVAAMIASWDVDFILSTGDNYYRPAGGKGGNGLDQYDNSVGSDYCPYLFDTGRPDSGTLDCPADEQSKSSNRFFPTIGNHDRHDTADGITNYLNYFELPGAGFDNSSGSERYYDFVWGPVHFFALDSDTALLDMEDMNAQKAWLEESLAASTSAWQAVYFHHAAYSSAKHGSDPRMQWPFAEWGADMVFQGHDHVYERILVEDIPYFVSGYGGRHLYEFVTAVAGSVVRYNNGFGAVLVTATDSDVTFEAWSLPGAAVEQTGVPPALIDCYSLPALQDECSDTIVRDLGPDVWTESTPQNMRDVAWRYLVDRRLSIVVGILVAAGAVIAVYFIMRRRHAT